MRAIDRRECAALGHSPKAALRAGLLYSLKPYTALKDGRPEAMMGVVPQSLASGRGTVWMLGTDEVYTAARELALLGPQILTLMTDQCPILENVVSVDNVRAISFLRHLGFKVGGHSVVRNGVEFIPFRYERAIQGLRLAG
jgi:ribosomal protein S18 acetylase RimI-like enzyme